MAQIPNSNADFNNYWNRVFAYLNTNKVRLAISTANITAITTLNTTWTTVYPQSQDPAVSTRAIMTSMHTTRTQMETALHVIFNDIADSVLTTTDRTELGLPAHDTVKTRRNAADHAPGLAVNITGHLQHEVHISDPANPGVRAMPEGQKVNLEHFVGAAGLAPGSITFTNIEQVSRFSHKENYTEDDAGKTAYYRACYVSTRGEKGPYSAVMSAVIG